MCFTWASRCARFEFGRKHCWVLCVFCGKWCKRLSKMDFPGKATRNTCKKWQKMAHFTSLHFSGFGLGANSRHFALNNTHCQGVCGAKGRAERKAHWESKAQKENARLTLPHFLLADLEFAVVWKWKYRNATLSLLLLNLIRMYVYVCVCRYMYIYIYDFVFVFHAPSRCAHDLNTTTTTPGENFVQVAWIFFKLKCEAKKKNHLNLCERAKQQIRWMFVPSTDLIFHFLFSFSGWLSINKMPMLS